jgi:hypothetical protein
VNGLRLAQYFAGILVLALAQDDFQHRQARGRNLVAGPAQAIEQVGRQ